MSTTETAKLPDYDLTTYFGLKNSTYSYEPLNAVLQLTTSLDIRII